MPNKGQLRYAEGAYWDLRYEKEAAEYEWFYGFNALKHVIRLFVPKQKLVLQVGCGNSNIAENMGWRGYHLVNADISSVVISQMQEKHASLPGVTWRVADCRKMPEFHDCQFGSVIDKGTLDALLCSDDADANIHGMLSEISRVLIPGGNFLLVTLGGPSTRLHMVCKDAYDWDVSVVLLPKVDSSQLQYDKHRGIPYNDVQGRLEHLGPFPVLSEGIIVGLPQPFEPPKYFYVYLCKRKPIQLGMQKQLPPGWTQAAQEIASRLQEQAGVSKHLFARGRRRNVIRLSDLKQRAQQDRATADHVADSSTAGDSDTTAANNCAYWAPDVSEATSSSGAVAAVAARQHIIAAVDMNHTLDMRSICSANLQYSDHL